MIIFCDGVFDLFHEGHVKHFKKIKYLYPESYLFVGVLNDQEATDYKRKPVFNENQRLSLVYSCKYVDKVTIDYPVIMTEEFMVDHKIDLVVHAFSNMSDYAKQLQFFEVPVRLNKMKIIDYKLEKYKEILDRPLGDSNGPSGEDLIYSSINSESVTSRRSS